MDSHSSTTAHADIVEILDRQRQAHLKDPTEPVATRVDRIERAITVLKSHESEFVEALKADFGDRSSYYTRLVDLAGSIKSLLDAKANIGKWVGREKRKAIFPLSILGAKAWVDYQPLGVVGVVSPWNLPVNLSFSPLASALAAGNRVMIKPSELTPHTSELMKSRISEYFDPEEVAIVTGDQSVGQAFCSLQFDHLLFTGSTAIGRKIMSAAAANLVPVTLELGGKCPAIIGQKAQMKQACERIMNGKTGNGGQLCLAPDYLLTPEDMVDEVVEKCRSAVREMFPKILANEDYTSVINASHHSRLLELVADAREKGAQVIEINPASENFSSQQHFKVPPTLLLNVSPDMRVMQEEIFGPLLPVVTYSDIQEAIDYVNSKPRALALYYFGNERDERARVLGSTVTGGVTINDTQLHYAQEDLPFGGVGDSGMGAYHGFDGFKQLSHAKAVYQHTPIDIAKMSGLKPPYGPRLDRFIKMQTK